MEITNRLLMPYTIRLISIDKQKNFVFTWILSQTGRKENGSNYGQEKILILLVIENPEKRRTKDIVLGI